MDKLLTGRENLMLMADLFHLGRVRAKARAEELLERFDLTEAADKLASTYSGGMQRKLDLAMTLVSDPQTIFLTTQYLEEADQLAGRIAVLDHGKVVAAGTPGELKRLIGGHNPRLDDVFFALTEEGRS